MRALVAASTLLLATPAVGQRTLTVAVAPNAPLASQAPDGRWTGPAIELMREAADGVDQPIRFVPAPAQGADAAFPAPATLEAPLRSAPLYTDTLALASTSIGLWSTARRMFTLQFLWVILALSALLLTVGAAVWFFERRQTDKDEECEWRGEDGRTGGVGKGFWWAGVTMTTIGYGDLVPKTLPGRAIAMVWMLVSMAITASLTAYIVSSSSIGPGGGSGDLADAVAGERVGVVAGGPANDSVAAVGGRLVRFRSLADALAALGDGRVDVVAASRAALAGVPDPPSIKATTVQLPLQVAAKPDAAPFVAQINRLTAAPSWWSRVSEAAGD